MNLLEVFDSNVRKFQEKDYIRYNGSGISYRQTHLNSLKTAALLKKNGIREGDRVALFCYNSPSFIYTLLGAWRLGAVVVPVNHKLRARELDYILEDSGAKLLLFDAQLEPVVREMNRSIVKISTLGKVEGADEFEPAMEHSEPLEASDSCNPDSGMTAQLLYTSGTTGNPKGCVLTHQNVFFASQIAATGLTMTRDERTLVAMPVWHSSPLNNWLGGTTYIGGTVVLLREYHPVHFLETIQNEKVTLYFGAPVSYALPLKMVPGFTDYDLSSVRCWIYGGGPISTEMSRNLMTAYKSDKFYQVFGMTETGPTGMVLYPEEQIGKAGSIGRFCLPSVEIIVVDDDGQEIPNGSIGEIWIRAYSTMKEYYNNSVATKEAMTEDGWYKTGDLARKDEDGYLFIVDRKKDMIITGGENVYSKEVEDALMTHPQVEDAAVIGTPHHEWGETVTAVLVTKENAPVSLDELKEHLYDKVASYKIPKILHFTEVLPRNPSGKVQKFLLKEQFVK